MGARTLLSKPCALWVFTSKTLQNRSLLGAIPKKASHTTTKPASCDTALGGRCYSWTWCSWRKPWRKLDVGIPNPRLWKSVNETTSSGYGPHTASPVGALHLATSFGRRKPFTTRHCSFTSITDEGIHSPILRRRWRRRRRWRCRWRRQQRT